jgi:hypothetical protein
VPHPPRCVGGSRLRRRICGGRHSHEPVLVVYLIMGWVVSGSGRVMSGCRVENHDPRPDLPHVWVGSGRVWSGFGFLVIIFGLSRVGSGYFLSSGENFDPRVSITRKLFLVSLSFPCVFEFIQSRVNYSLFFLSFSTLYFCLHPFGTKP